jgi:tRNA-splicing ligase RtcB (3'-phosphate/5'-hydroxy nucleic acid ligase)
MRSPDPVGPRPRQIGPATFEIAASGGMRVPARIYATPGMLGKIEADGSLEQACNVAHLPGIVRASIAMPDAHCGYGFPIGGVAAMDANDGVVSPGGIGYDINCGVRLATTLLSEPDLGGERLERAVFQMQRDIPAGVGSQGAIPKLSEADLEQVLARGAAWAIDRGYGSPEDLEAIEEAGAIPGADPAEVSSRARQRGAPQLGTLGSGNHFAELDVVDELFDPELASGWGLRPRGVCMLVHTGSRGLGYQVCDDFLKLLNAHLHEFGFSIPDRQLVAAPLESTPGRRYRAAMAAAANFAFANRQVLMSLGRDALVSTLAVAPRDLGFRLLYDQAHNILKHETHEVDGQSRRLAVHRKGATRAFPAGREELPLRFRATGQPVLIPGDMGRASYVCVGTAKALSETWGSAAHGAGREMSRTEAIRRAGNRSIRKELAQKGIVVASRSRKGLVEEMPEAYKDVSNVVEALVLAGVARKVARLRPIGVVKG